MKTKVWNSKKETNEYENSLRTALVSPSFDQISGFQGLVKALNFVSAGVFEIAIDESIKPTRFNVGGFAYIRDLPVGPFG